MGSDQARPAAIDTAEGLFDTVKPAQAQRATFDFLGSTINDLRLDGIFPEPLLDMMAQIRALGRSAVKYRDPVQKRCGQTTDLIGGYHPSDMRQIDVRAQRRPPHRAATSPSRSLAR